MSDNDNSRSPPDHPPGSSSAHAAGKATERPEFLDAHSRHRLAWALGIAGGLVLLLLAGTYGAYFLRFGGLPSGDQGHWGQFGDFVGGTLNSLMGLLTVLALVFTVVLQTRQLELSRDELRATRAELARSTAAQRDAATAMNGQLEQARLTAQAQREAAAHLLATAQSIRQAGRIQALDTVVEKLTGVRSNDVDLRAEYSAAIQPVPGGPVSPYLVDLTRQRAIQHLVRLLLKEGDLE